MNAMGELGNFIMTYQEPLQAAAIAIFSVGGVICIGKAIANAAKKRKLLEQINDTVSEINTNVRSLGEKRTEVIYIDGRPNPEDSTPAPAPAAEVKAPVVLAREPQSEIQKESRTPEEDVKPAVKYFSRDCAVAKDGRKYTFEELDAQIRD